MVREIYEALVSAGVDHDKAVKAAEVMAQSDQKHNDLLLCFERVDARFEKQDGRINTLTWMVGFCVALTLGNLALILQVLSRLPAVH